MRAGPALGVALIAQGCAIAAAAALEYAWRTGPDWLLMLIGAALFSALVCIAAPLFGAGVFEP